MTYVDDGVYRNDCVALSCGYHEAAIVRNNAEVFAMH